MKFNYQSLFFLLSLSLIVICFIYFLFKKIENNKKKEKQLIKKHLQKGFLFCSVRGLLKTKGLDSSGEPTEELWRVRLVGFLLKKGFSKDSFFFEYQIPIGHKGKNSLRVDLLIKDKKNKEKTVLVAEVKKKYSASGKSSAIQHQLVPAMLLLNCTKGVYFDGSPNACFVSKNENNELIEKPFLFTRR